MTCRFCREVIPEGSDVIEDEVGNSICEQCHDERLQATEEATVCE